MGVGTGGLGEYRDTVWICKDGIRKAKANMKQDLERGMKSNKKGLYKDISWKKRPRTVYAW